MSEPRFDLIVVGTGAAGMAAAIRGAELGASVGLIERGTLGGTCVNIGCIPSKTLISAAARYHSSRTGSPGIAPANPELDWPEVERQKSVLVAGLRQTKYVDVLESYPSIRLVRGPARMGREGAVHVGDTEYGAGRVVLATGAAPVLPAIPGLAEARALDSTSAMALERLPESLIVVGGGYVGLELGQMFAKFGTEVTVLVRGERIAKREDPAISAALREHMEADGIRVLTGARVVRVDRDGGEVRVELEGGADAPHLKAEHFLAATGRRANTEGLGLADAGVSVGPRGFIEVDESLRTSNPHIFAAGDVVQGPAFVYVAAAGGKVAAENALTSSATAFDLSVVPRVMFTDPQVAAVGLGEAEAREAGLSVLVRSLDLKHLARAAASGDARGFIKIVAQEGTGRVLGVHALGPNAGELMGEAALAVRFQLTVTDLATTLHPYLTWTEGLKLAAQTFTQDVGKLSCCA